MDSYAKLRPQTEIERCECAEITELILVYIFTPNPIHCALCRNEVDPELLKLSAKETDDIACCFRVYASLFDLWLDSGEYESLAKEKLENPLGQVNQDGMTLVAHLSERWPTYYWWFHDIDDGEPAYCPACKAALDTDVRWGSGKCDRCRVIL